ncbi:MAG: coproporphyrinogen III oxidase, partial [Cytophagales bacterium]
MANLNLKSEVMDKQEIVIYFKDLQERITKGLEESDGKCVFKEDLWERPGGGGGRTRTTTNGNILEKGGVGFSAVEGLTPDKVAYSLGVEVGSTFFATGVSLVMHPFNPFVPIIHMNVRYFEMSTGHWWFGGGIDLTPHYIDVNDAKWFHQRLKSVCDTHD